MKRAIFLVAFSIYLGLNVLVLPFCNFGLDQYDYSYRSWPWWLVNHLRTTQESFNVALLGSSLMLSSINECDANFAGKNIDASSHHQSLYLDNKLGTAFDGNFRTFNLATPGQMPSDAYFLTKAMMQLGQHPKAIIYGIAPRDFLDSRLASPADTEPFRYLKRFVSASAVAYDVFGLERSALDNFLSNWLFLHQHAVDIQTAFSRRLDASLQSVLPAPRTNTPFTYWDRVALLSQYKAGELYPGAAVNSPVAWQPGTHWKRDNIEDYLERYRKPNPESFNLQLRFLNRLISLCQDEKIEIVLVNMPLSSMNINILGQKRYAEFQSKIRTVCIARNIKLIDLGGTLAFGNEYFEDSAHLNGFGGRRFLDLLTEKMKEDAQLAAVFGSAGKPVDQGNALASRGHPGPGAE
jgi:hypothetical protein